MNHEEAKIQAAIVKALRQNGYFCHSVSNEAAGDNPVRQAQFITMGLYPGVADLVVWLPGGRIGYLEIKTSTGKLSPNQEKFRDRCLTAGVPWGIARSVEEALKYCVDWEDKRWQ